MKLLNWSMESLQDKFNQVDLQGKAVLLQENGEYISTREYYAQKVKSLLNAWLSG